MSRLDRGSLIRESTASARRRRGWWLVITVLFLTMIALSLWVWVRSAANSAEGGEGYEHNVGEPAPSTADEEDLPAVCPVLHGEEAAEVGSEGGSAPFVRLDTIAPTQESKNEEVVYHRRKNDRMEIALSFDDGPHPRLTPVILEILAEYGIKATFFMVGENVGYYTAAARAVTEAGHEIGNHTFSHRKFDRLGAEELRREILSCEEAIASVSDAPVRFIRPPEGQMSDTMRQVMEELDYRVILWDVDTRDWAHTPPETICRHILDTVQAGDIILMHDFIGYNSPTPEALRLVIPALLECGFRFVTVGELVEAD